MRRYLFILALCAAAAPAGADAPTAGEIKEMTSQSQRTAEAALGTLAKLVTENTARRMGFDTPDQVRDARLGAPLADYMIGLEDLQKYAGEDDPGALFRPTGEMHYPVLTGETTRCLITVAGMEGEWKAVSYGAPVLSRALAEAVARTDASPETVFAVRIPALNLAFVGHRRGEEIMLTAALTAGQFGLEDGMTAPAREVLGKLQPEALRHEGLPR